MNTMEVTNKLNISAKALRIYEKLGIVVPKREENNYRNYSEDDILKLRQLTLLKEMGISLKDIKKLLEKEFGSNKILHGLDLQLKAVDRKIDEFNNIRMAITESINELINSKDDENYNIYFEKIQECLDKNRKVRNMWIDKWGFDSWAENYDKSVADDSDDELHLFEKYDYMLDVISDKVKTDNLKRVLDIGCGTGNLYGKLKSFTDYTGIDQSIDMLMEFRKKFNDATLMQGNFLDKELFENEFDAVLSTYAFHHLNSHEKEEALNIMLRYLRDGGKIIIGDLMFLNEKERNKKREEFINNGREDLWEIVNDEYYTDIESIEKTAKKFGCKTSHVHIGNFTWILEIIK